MRITLPLLILAAPLPLTGCPPLGDRGYITDSRLPPKIREASMEAQLHDFDQNYIRQRICETYGQPTRGADSIEHWRASGGVLTSDPVIGIVFITDTNEQVAVIRNQHRLGDMLLHDYGMTTLREKWRTPSAYYLGLLRLDRSGRYEFTVNNSFPEQRRAQGKNFFIDNASGTFELSYLEKLTPDTLIESIPDHTRVAKIIFRSLNGKEQTYAIARAGNRLQFEHDEPMKFELDSTWNQRWE